MAAIAGFAVPNLHGQCTIAIAARQVLKHFAGNDPARLVSVRGRFSAPVFPGETLVTEMWRDRASTATATRVRFRAKVAERDVVVLLDGLAEVAPAAPSRL